MIPLMAYFFSALLMVPVGAWILSPHFKPFPKSPLELSAIQASPALGEIGS